MYERKSNLSQADLELSNVELSALSKVWKERKSELEHGGEYQEFLKKLQREWAIETGIIERLYTWDRGVTEVLIEQGIDSTIIAHQSGMSRDQATHVKDIIDDQLTIIDHLFSFVKGEQPLTEHFIRGLQERFTAHQEFTDARTPAGDKILVPILRGEYKQQPNNPRRPDGEIHEYCPTLFVEEEMERLVAWYKEAEANASVEVLAAWLHHRFTQIHPFQDGNGRVARALATLVFLKEGLFPLIIRDQDRDKEYIPALELADKGDLQALVQLFAKRQKASILAAIGLEQQVQQSRYTEEIIASAIKVLKNRVAGETKKLNQVYEIADKLYAVTNERLHEISTRLNKQLGQVEIRNHQLFYKASVIAANKDSQTKHYFHHQIIEVAKHFGYFANLDKYRAWIRLSIYTDDQFEYVISFHGYGYGDSGIMAASSFTCQRIQREDGYGTDVINTRPASPDFFQFNYEESIESTEKRFGEWLEASIAIALAEWKRLLQA
ncbi:MAG: Fic family protein [Acidobacteria bacterium]|nr:Fic family protein [Acidobacteriota bacterium]MBI3425523.1 Fic family protein [Acidobacteriota bacterium]